MRMILYGMLVLIEEEWLAKHAVIIQGKKIICIVPETKIREYLPASCYQFSDKHYLIPGLIDLHIHGGYGVDVMDADPSGIKFLSQLLAKEGVTGFLATTMTSSQIDLENALCCIANIKKAEKNSQILGIHLEGPFITKEKKGAHEIQHLQIASGDLIKRWQRLAQGHIKLVTFAPELPGAITFIRSLLAMNIIPAIGHTNATYEETKEAILAGARYATHLFNAMSGIHHRAPGAAGALLLSSETMAELIVDDYHLHSAVVELAFKLKGKNQLILVTDAIRAKCLPSGTYDLGGQSVVVENGKATLDCGTLAGSTLSLLEAIKKIQQMTDCRLIEAIQLASFNPAQVLKLTQKGKIAEGMDADVVVLDANLNVVLTIGEGRVLQECDTLLKRMP